MSEELDQAHTHLEKEVKLRTQELESVIYTISHDLKSPVVSMQGMASILMEDYADRFDEKGKHYLRRSSTMPQRPMTRSGPAPGRSRAMPWTGG